MRVDGLSTMHTPIADTMRRLHELRTNPKPDKGLDGGSCNVTACQKPGAYYFNKGSRAYYCWSCAKKINQQVLPDGTTLFGKLTRDPRGAE